MLPDDVAIVTAASPVEILSAATADAVSALPVNAPINPVAVILPVLGL